MPRTAKAVALSEVERATLEQMARHPPKWRSRLRAQTARDWQSCLAAAHEKQVSVAVIKAALVRHGFVWKRNKAKETSGLLEILKENGLVLYFLPPYSPELNRIERFWHKMKYELMAFKHRTTEALEAAVDKALAGFGIEYQFTLC